MIQAYLCAQLLKRQHQAHDQQELYDYAPDPADGYRCIVCRAWVGDREWVNGLGPYCRAHLPRCFCSDDG